MDQELTTSFGLLERRLALMRELASSLEQVQTAVVRSDLRGINGHTARQRELWAALRQLETEALGRPPRNPIAEQSREQKIWVQLPEDAVSPQVRQRWKALAQELTQVEMRVSQLNQVYGALLRRARRTLQIFMRVLASSAITYAPPKREPAIAPSTFPEVSHV
jgi:flagellar biosynthesis/type III secretory pathway chaperone